MRLNGWLGCTTGWWKTGFLVVFQTTHLMFDKRLFDCEKILNYFYVSWSGGFGVSFGGEVLTVIAMAFTCFFGPLGIQCWTSDAVLNRFQKCVGSIWVTFYRHINWSRFQKYWLKVAFVRPVEFSRILHASRVPTSPLFTNAYTKGTYPIKLGKET